MLFHFKISFNYKINITFKLFLNDFTHVYSDFENKKSKNHFQTYSYESYLKLKVV